jgi:hypothetical protein
MGRGRASVGCLRAARRRTPGTVTWAELTSASLLTRTLVIAHSTHPVRRYPSTARWSHHGGLPVQGRRRILDLLFGDWFGQARPPFAIRE